MRKLDREIAKRHRVSIPLSDVERGILREARGPESLAPFIREAALERARRMVGRSEQRRRAKK